MRTPRLAAAAAAVATVTALAAFAACSHSSNGNGCFVIQPPSLAPSTQVTQITLDVKFLEVETTFAQTLGITFSGVGTPIADSSPPIGGQFSFDADHAIVGPFVGGSTYWGIAPKNHAAGTFLPRGVQGGGAPGVGSVSTFTQAPGADRQCVTAVDSVMEPVTGVLHPLNTIPLVANGELAPGLSVAWEALDSTQINQVMNAIASNSSRNLLTAPTVTTYDNQRAVFVAQQFVANVGDLDTGAQAAIANQSPHIGLVFGGVTLDVVPTVSADRQFIVMEVRPTASGFVGVSLENASVQNNQITIQLPVVQTVAVKTSLQIADQGTVLIGGLRDVPANADPTTVPLLSRIPYINRLFRSSGPGSSAKELMILVTAKLVK